MSSNIITFIHFFNPLPPDYPPLLLYRLPSRPCLFTLFLLLTRPNHLNLFSSIPPFDHCPLILNCLFLIFIPRSIQPGVALHVHENILISTVRKPHTTDRDENRARTLGRLVTAIFTKFFIRNGTSFTPLRVKYAPLN